MWHLGRFWKRLQEVFAANLTPESVLTSSHGCAYAASVLWGGFCWAVGTVGIDMDKLVYVIWIYIPGAGKGTVTGGHGDSLWHQQSGSLTAGRC